MPFKNNCTIYDNSSNITNFTVNIINNETNIIVYEFYDYFHNSSLTETIDFNLMMITGLIGDSLLKCIGFGWTSFVLSFFNFGAIFWIFSFKFEFSEEGIFDYGVIKMISLSSIYIMLLIGIGGSALLSQKIIVDALNKYKIFDIANRLNSLFKNEPSKKANQLIELNSNIKESDKKNYNKKIKDLQKGINNKFEFFFIICVVTTF